MSFLAQAEVNPGAPPLAGVRSRLGFVPNLVQAQMLLPRLVEADSLIANALLFRDAALTRKQKELILLALSAARENRYCLALHCQVLRSLGVQDEQLRQVVMDYRRAALPPSETALLDFALGLTPRSAAVCQDDIESLRAAGFEDEHILEAVLISCWSSYLCALASGLGVDPDFDPPDIPPAPPRQTVFREHTAPRPNHSLPSLRTVDLKPETFPPFAYVQEQYGFIPNALRKQTIRPDLIEAQIGAFDIWLSTGDILSRARKEYVFLAVSASNLNTYCVALHCETLRAMGLDEEESERIALDHHRANLAERDKVLLDVCLKLARTPAGFGAADVDELRKAGFPDEQILEAFMIVAVANFLNRLDVGLGAKPDFDTKVRLGLQEAHPSSPAGRLLDRAAPSPPEAPEPDPDAAFVARAQASDDAAFEELVRRHGRRVQRTLMGLLGQTEDVEDAVQDTFVKAYQHLDSFQGRSKFATWLTRIAVNTGLQRLRGRKQILSLDDSQPEEADFVPRQVEAWQDNPEQACSKSEMRTLILESLMKLPLKYRSVVMLRDLQQLPTRETADALGLGIPAVKARLFRGRLMLREALSPHFSRKDVQKIDA